MSSSGEDPLPKDKSRPRPERDGGEKKEAWGGKEAGGGGRSRRRDGEPNDPLVGTTAHVPCGGRVEVGTVTRVHTRKSVVVWVKYLNNPKLYLVQHHLIFGTAEAAEAHLQQVRKGKTATTNPPSPNEAR